MGYFSLVFLLYTSGYHGMSNTNLQVHIYFYIIVYIFTNETGIFYLQQLIITPEQN